MALTVPLLTASLVAIALPPGTSEEVEARVIAGCAAALGPAACHRADQRDIRDFAFLAVIAWEGARLQVVLREGGPSGAVLVRREMRFEPQDQALDRWTAAGLMVAALTAAQTGTPQPQSHGSEAPSASPVGTRPAAPPERTLPPRSASSRSRGTERPQPHSPPVLTIYLGGAVGAAGGEGVRYGGAERAMLLWPARRLGFVVSARQSWQLAEPELRWMDVSAGLASRLVPWRWPWGLDLSGEGVVQRASARAKERGELASAHSARAGARVGLVGSWPLSHRWALWLGTDVSWLWPKLEVRLHGETAAAEGSTRWASTAGVRFCPGAAPPRSRPR